MTASDLDSDTRVTGERGVYGATLSRAWEIWGPNGGYLATIALRAAGAEASIPTPASIYCQFLRVAKFEHVEARVTVLQRGRRSESIRVTLIQDDKPVLEGLVRTALSGPGLEHDERRAPDVPRPETLPTADELRKPGAPRFAFWDNIEARVLSPERLDPDRGALPSHWLEWYRYRPVATFTDPFLDAARALILIDTLGWPAVWLRHPKPAYLAPSLDVAVFFHTPFGDSEWLLAEQESPIGSGGLIASTGRVFAAEGRLVASGGAQLLCVDAPRG